MPCSQHCDCLNEIDAALIRPLVYLRGVDVNGCDSYYPPQVTDVCAALKAFQTTTSLKIGDKIVGSDCKLHEITSAIFQAITAINTPSANSAITSNVLSVDVNPTWVKSLFSATGAGCLTLNYNNGAFTASIDNNCVVSQGLIVQDTQTLDLTKTSNTIQGNVRLNSEVAGNNQLSVLNGASPNGGLFVPKGAGIEVLDTQTTDLTNNNGVISSDVRINSEPTSGNQLSVLNGAQADGGLFVPKGAGLTSVNTSGISTSITNGVISSTPNLAGGDNILQLGAGGLYAPPPPPQITIKDTATVDLTLAANELKADVIVAPIPNTRLFSLPNGLYVPPSTISVIGTTAYLDGQAQFSACELIGGIGNGKVASFLGKDSSGNCVYDNNLISTDLCNSVEFRANGFYSQRKSSFAISTEQTYAERRGAGVTGADFFFGMGNTTSATEVDVQPLTLIIQNGCTESDVTLHTEMGHFSWMGSGNDWAYRYYLSYRINGGNWTNVNPHFIHEIGFDANDSATVIRVTNNGTALDTFHLQPQDSIEFALYTKYSVAIGAGGAPLFAVYPDLNAQGVSMKMTAQVLAN